ncbi:MAG: hypothetical protein WKF47_06290 [Geodermatophilaceae bacterium]
MADARWYNSDFVRRTWEGEAKRAGSRKVPTVSRLPEGWTPPEQRRGFVFIGRWIANKGIDTLVDAYALARARSGEVAADSHGQRPVAELD